MERLPASASPGSIPVRSSKSLVSQRLQKAFPVFFLRYGDAALFGTTIIPIGEQTRPKCHTMGGHNMQVFLATQMRITFECPVSAVLHGDTLECISAPRRLPSTQTRRSEKI